MKVFVINKFSKYLSSFFVFCVLNNLSFVICTPKVNNVVNIFHHVGVKDVVEKPSVKSSLKPNVEHSVKFGVKNDTKNGDKFDKENNLQDNMQDDFSTIIGNNTGNNLDGNLNNNLELGNLVFYFDSKPVINFIPERDQKNINPDGKTQKTFIFPYAQIKDDKLIKKVNSETGKGYKLKVERVNTPIKGLKVTLLYDESVFLDYKFFDSISGHKGIVFNFYNKNLIDKLKNLDDRVLKTVCSKNCGSTCKKKIVVVDFGHGGSDFGAIGQFGLIEKDITFSVGSCVQDILKKKGFEVFLTRRGDQDLALDERTTLANNFFLKPEISFDKEKKILISIHANSCTNNVASGLETFFLEDTCFSDSVFFYPEQYNKIILDACCKKNNASSTLASCINSQVYSKVLQYYPSYKNRGVKKSVSQLLLGVHMPAALIEIGFLSNLQDSEFIKNKKNQELIAQGICEGIIKYFN